jgi:TPP-dependent pyruvate/acetoin dehydrogenase alpha subunit
MQTDATVRADVQTRSPVEVYRWMALCRALDRVLCGLNPRWFPAEGEEATIVGAFCDLGPEDVAAVHYRDPFVVYAMRGAELWRLVAQVLGKPAGYSMGRAVPFTGPFTANIVPWVAGDLGSSLGIATGAAFALQERGTGNVCVCSFGDGTSNRGDFHENLVIAATWRLPIVYVCQNNGWAISQRRDGYLPAPVVDRAAGYGIPGVTVDGQDIEAVRSALAEAVARARTGGGPTLIEARTTRIRGHWAGDQATYRDEVEREKVVDPLPRYAERLRVRGEATDADLAAIHAEADATVAAAVARAQAAPDATADDLATGEVYA